MIGFPRQPGEQMRLGQIQSGARWTVVAAMAQAAFGGCGNGRAPRYHAGGTVTFPDGTPQERGSAWGQAQPRAPP